MAPPAPVAHAPMARPFWVRNPWMWRLVALGFLSFLVVAAVAEVRSDDRLVTKLLVLVLMAAYGAVYLTALPGEVGGDRPVRTVVVLAVLGIVLVGVLGPDSIGLLMYALVSAVTTLPPARYPRRVGDQCRDAALHRPGR